ncbi:hydrolase [Planctomicrobium sp. SH661]|uniref:hydrolase n=1 Tax=Planctomicrobium sp. SH661 TaxID=3448124 RepID=UPI003F5B5039
MTNRYTRSPELLSAATSRLVIVDMQEKFAPIIPDFDLVLSGCVKLIQAARILNVPVSATEQYPRGLGTTVPAIAELLPHRPEKVRFSCAEALDWALQSGLEDGRRQIVLAGIETHICMLQTALDLVSAGFEVFIAADATRSRQAEDREIALRRMSDAGVRIITSEMAMFEWCEVAGSEQFKQISRLVTGR